MMRGEPAKGIEDIVRRNVAALRSKANLTQQGLADQMLLRGIPWTRETVAQVETTSRRLGFTEAIAVAACLDVPVARLTATGALAVGVGENEWSAAYLGAAVAGTAGDIYPPESYAGRAPVAGEPVDPAPPKESAAQASSAPAPIRVPVPPGDEEEEEVPTAPTPLFAPMSVDDATAGRRRAPQERRSVEPEPAEPRGRRASDPPGPRPAATPAIPAPSTAELPTAAPAPQKAAERIERRMRLRVTASDVDATAQHLWSRSLESERERRVTDRHALTGGSLQTIRGHVSRDLDREIAYEIGRRPEDEEPSTTRPAAAGSDTEFPSEELTQDEATWEATRLNIILANKGYSDSDVTRWWNFTRHQELGERTIAETWKSGAYEPVIRLIESLPDKHGPTSGYFVDE